jgi:hypothetical protein
MHIDKYIMERKNMIIVMVSLSEDTMGRQEGKRMIRSEQY